jgi:hypothetical protein
LEEKIRQGVDDFFEKKISILFWLTLIYRLGRKNGYKIETKNSLGFPCYTNFYSGELNNFFFNFCDHFSPTLYYTSFISSLHAKFNKIKNSKNRHNFFYQTKNIPSCFKITKSRSKVKQNSYFMYFYSHPNSPDSHLSNKPEIVKNVQLVSYLKFHKLCL